MVIAFIADHHDRFGVEPICAVLTKHGVKIAPSTFYAATSRAPSARSVRDAQLLEVIRVVHADRTKGRGVAGYRKMWHLLRRDGHQVARCTVERLMRRDGLRGATRGRTFKTTMADPAAARPADLVKRDFTAPAPNRLWVVDFTYVPTWAGVCFTAFVTDVYSRRIVGWRTANRMPTELPLDALEMALWVRSRAGQDVTGVVHHSDAGSQGGFQWSSQHLDDGGVFWVHDSKAPGWAGQARPVVVGSGRLTGRCAHRCGRREGLSPHARCRGRSGG
jgi:putative transposase